MGLECRPARANEVNLQQSTNLSGLWFSPSGQLVGYRLEGWKVTLLRWGSDPSRPPTLQEINLDELTPPDGQYRGKLGATPSTQAPISASPYLRSQKSPVSQVSPRSSEPSAAGSSPANLNLAGASPPMAISRDVDSLAWFWNGDLYLISPIQLKPAAQEASRVGDLRLARFENSPEQFPEATRSHSMSREGVAMSQISRQVRVLRTVVSAEQPNTKYGLKKFTLRGSLFFSISIHFVDDTRLILQEQDTQQKRLDESFCASN